MFDDYKMKDSKEYHNISEYSIVIIYELGFHAASFSCELLTKK